MESQLSIFPEQSVPKSQKIEKNPSIMKMILRYEKSLEQKDELIKLLREENKALKAEINNLNEKYKQVAKENIDAFGITKSSNRPMIAIFADWIGYRMFVKDGKFDKLPAETQKIYEKIHKECVLEAYEAFTNRFGDGADYIESISFSHERQRLRGEIIRLENQLEKYVKKFGKIGSEKVKHWPKSIKKSEAGKRYFRLKD
ncbi:hypothetical protein [Fonticella tunisiensis]|uniref:Uncharacterized protein n=1 Tax=Fonticella tunisiensis TaxID=1096341 RepID=A0A4R7KWW3_9CLOT|nr:hypothetical protein [Fonticella tunisiensis]TDT63396.1 hypothetical protein EDD71_102158 [Fonticella tunisiensis]